MPFLPLKELSLYQQIRKALKQDDIISSINKFFQDLQKEIDKAISIAKIQAKQKYIKYCESQNELLKVYNIISLVEELRRILHQQLDVQEKISEILRQLEEEKTNNTQLLQEALQNHNTKFDLDIPSKANEEITNQIQQIQFFYEDPSLTQSRNLLLSSNLIKSKFQNSQELEISKVQQACIIAKSLREQKHKMAYLDFNLDPNKQYIFRFSIWMKNGQNAYILFGLQLDSTKDTDRLSLKNMCYCERNNEYGIGKGIKGNPFIKETQKIKKSIGNLK